MRGIHAAWVLAAAFLTQPALAQNSPVSLRVESALAWDANVFRLPESAPDPQLARGISGKSDLISTTTVGLRIIKDYSQQNLLFDIAQTLRRYEKFTSLDSENLSYRGEWQWHFSPYVSGTLSAGQTETPVPFDLARSTEANTLIAANRSFSLAIAPFGGWHLFGVVRQGEQKYARPFAAQPNSSQNGFEAGLRYTAASQSTISLTRRSQRGTSTSQAAGTPLALGTGDFTFDETELQAAWPVSGKSTLNGRLTRIARHYTAAPERDFSGMAGGFSHSWIPTGKLSLLFSAQRSLTPFIQDVRSSYIVQNTLSVTPSWQLSEKIRVSMAASHQVSDYRGAVGAQVAPARHDTVRAVSVSAGWSPVRAVSVTATLLRDRRVSNDLQVPYETTVASVSASFNF